MRDFLPYIVSGIAAGSIYGLAGTGLVLTYKTSGIFNFAHGAIATSAAYFFYWFHVDHKMPWLAALLLSVFVLGPLVGLALEVVSRRLARQRTPMKIVGTVGIILLVQALATIKYGTTTRRVEPYLPKAYDTFRVGGVYITYQQLTIAIVALVAVSALYGLFRFSRMGVAMRAVVDNSELVELHGTDPFRVRRIAWVIGATFAALSGVLMVPVFGLEALVLTFLVVQAFGAAAIGGFSSIPLTFAGGLLIGILSDLTKKYTVTHPTWAGIPGSLPFIVLFVVLLVLPKRKLLPPTALTVRPPLRWRAPAPVQLVIGVIVVGVLLAVPNFAGTKIAFYSLGLTQVILMLSLGLLVRTSGQVSLCHAAFAAIGATAFSQLRVDHGVPWLPAVLLAALVAVPVGALIAIPAIRLSGLFLALATFGFGIMVERLCYVLNIMFTPLTEGRQMPRPSVGSSDRGYYYVILCFALASAVVMALIHRGRLGRILRGMSDSPTALTTMGLNVNVTRVIVFCISAFFAAVAGTLYGSSVGFASTTDRYYGSFTSLILVAILALAPFNEPWFAFMAMLNATIPGYVSSAHTQDWMNAGFGLFALLIALEGGTKPMPAGMRQIFERFRRRRRDHGVAAAPQVERVDTRTRTGLRVEHLEVRFGGLVAVKDLSFEAPTGRITGLIGPNGAGKTTTFNAASGLNRPSQGRVLLHGQDISHLSPSARSRRGLGRTFQRMELCETLTVAQNVALGREAGMAGARVPSQLAARPSQAREVARWADAAMELCGIGDLAGDQAGALSTGHRRLVELARCLAGPFDLLLLDEPSSGLDRDETRRFGEILQRVVAERDCGILLVEHDMSLVLNVCTYIYVLDFGELIFEGTAPEVSSSPIVRAAYLGEEEPSVPAMAASMPSSADTGHG